MSCELGWAHKLVMNPEQMSMKLKRKNTSQLCQVVFKYKLIRHLIEEYLVLILNLTSYSSQFLTQPHALPTLTARPKTRTWSPTPLLVAHRQGRKTVRQICIQASSPAGVFGTPRPHILMLSQVCGNALPLKSSALIGLSCQGILETSPRQGSTRSFHPRQGVLCHQSSPRPHMHQGVLGHWFLSRLHVLNLIRSSSTLCQALGATLIESLALRGPRPEEFSTTSP